MEIEMKRLSRGQLAWGQLAWGMVGGGPAHAPEKWEPVLGQAFAPTKESGR